MTAERKPGDAARRYLRVAEHQPTAAVLATDWRSMPPSVKRYPPGEAVALGMDVLGRILHDSYGLTRYRWDSLSAVLSQRVSGMAVGRSLRPVASGGGLFPSEIYLVAGPEPTPGRDRAAGVLHYDPAAHALDPVRTGDWRRFVAEALHEPARPEPAELYLVITTIFARTAFKYQEFGYRLQCLDSGVLTGQLLTMMEAAGLVGEVSLRFSDEDLTRLLGVNPDSEAVLVVIGVRPGAGCAAGPPPDNGRHRLADSPVRQPSSRTRPIGVLHTVPLTRDLHRSARAAADPAAALPPPLAAVPTVGPGAESHPLPHSAAPLPAGLPRRRSLDGRFGYAALTLFQLAGLLRATYRWAGSPPAGSGLDHVRLCCVVHRVTGLQPGMYVYEPDTHQVTPVRQTDLRVAMTQPDIADARFTGDHGAGAVVVPVGDYEAGFRTIGDRWFQMQNVPAGIVVQRTTLAAAALGLDCRILCAYETDHLAEALGFGDGPLRPLCQVLVGSPGSETGYDQLFPDPGGDRDS
ncbi:SagB family peptide dehydrogenase [Virgisporangium aurantiacum]|uniref:Nitroreductase domain-containing protein n=1 Tax=Virgisporangium aurantiacum TaxID=175570 RepID=A0A8J3ZJ95_9ACTN|nr:SagB family peptide dehydrogenase [Virgisporangium aurantiacum]GIJ62468.1 hypothetical protein Vau01_099840 [Virgisporangium aurantiacum]